MKNWSKQVNFGFSVDPGYLQTIGEKIITF